MSRILSQSARSLFGCSRYAHNLLIFLPYFVPCSVHRMLESPLGQTGILRAGVFRPQSFRPTTRRYWPRDIWLATDLVSVFKLNNAILDRVLNKPPRIRPSRHVKLLCMVRKKHVSILFLGNDFAAVVLFDCQTRKLNGGGWRLTRMHFKMWLLVGTRCDTQNLVSWKMFPPSALATPSYVIDIVSRALSVALIEVVAFEYVLNASSVGEGRCDWSKLLGWGC